MPVLFAATIFLSAALLFVLEPMFARMVLPLLGGSPAVWNTTMVFYQATLLGGYVYAHAVSKLTVRRQITCQAAVLLLPAFVLPFGASRHGTPPGGENPIPWLLELLVLTVGPPFFAVSTSGPLLQRWFVRTGHGAARDPYFLYAASNLGSLLGLLGYPLVVEPQLTLLAQSRGWTVGYLTVAGLTLACAWFVMHSKATDPGPPPVRTETLPGPAVGHADLARRLRWVFWAFVPSSLLLGVTTHLTSDVGSLPLLWVVPLSVYLLTFVVAFGWPRLAPRTAVARAMAIVVVLVTITLAMHANEPFAFILALDLVLLALVGLLLHGCLARDRPDATQVTEFYLWVGLGGVLGGVFNSLVAPAVFSSVVEYPLVLVLACMAMPPFSERRDAAGRLGRWLDFALPALLGGLASGSAALAGQIGLSDPRAVLLLTFGWTALLLFSFSRRPLRFGLGVAALLLVGRTFTAGGGTLLHEERSFFGIHRVIATPNGQHLLRHGSTFHGLQWIDPAKHDQPLAYYHRQGPFGRLFADRTSPGRPLRVGLVGLGSGALVAYARAGDSWTAYEIDPVVDRLARDTRYFTYLAGAPVAVRTVLGDARLSLAADASERYNVLIIDAYSSDAVPVHLLTREAVDLYLKRLAPGGILAFHLSSRHLDLRPVIAAIAQESRLICRVRDDFGVTLDQYLAGRYPTRVAVVARTLDDLGGLARDPLWLEPVQGNGLRTWTDDYSSLLSLYR